MRTEPQGGWDWLAPRGCSPCVLRPFPWAQCLDSHVPILGADTSRGACGTGDGDRVEGAPSGSSPPSGSKGDPSRQLRREGAAGPRPPRPPGQPSVFQSLLLLTRRAFQGPDSNFRELPARLPRPFRLIARRSRCPQWQSSSAESRTEMTWALSRLRRCRAPGSENRTRTHIHSVLSSSG